MKRMNYSWELSSFDTEILGFKTAKITHIDSSDDKDVINRSISDLKKDLKNHRITYITYRLSADDYSMIQTLEENGFILVDSLLTLATNLTISQRNDFPYILKAAQEDYPQIIDLAGSIFRGVSRYYHDPIIPTEKGDIIYRTWMKNSLEGSVADVVFVWKDEKGILGFITLQKKGQIPLIAVSEKARGKGIGKKMIFAALDTFTSWGLDRAVIETQTTNIQALGLYYSCGFNIIGSYLTLRWHASLM